MPLPSTPISLQRRVPVALVRTSALQQRRASPHCSGACDQGRAPCTCATGRVAMPEPWSDTEIDRQIAEYESTAGLAATPADEPVRDLLDDVLRIGMHLVWPIAVAACLVFWGLAIYQASRGVTP